MQTVNLSAAFRARLFAMRRFKSLYYGQECKLNFFATEYTIHFDDTMAYGSHHFLTAFKFQCAARESFLFGDRVFDHVGVHEALDKVHLLTVDAYARIASLQPANEQLPPGEWLG